MNHFKWSKSEKKKTRLIFLESYGRECQKVMQDVKELLAELESPTKIWVIEEYLSKARRKIDEKYDYRYSVLPLVLARLAKEGWISIDELEFLSEDKYEEIKRLVSSDVWL